MFVRNIPQKLCLKMAFSIFILKSSARYICSQIYMYLLMVVALSENFHLVICIVFQKVGLDHFTPCLLDLCKVCQVVLLHK